MLITATELKTNLGKYLELAAKQDIYVTKNGRRVAKLTSATTDKVALLDSLVGIVPKAVDMDDARIERLSRQ
ncbi:MAG: type II toxin-antitoxin system Phd/YefM family antitoxin [Bacillota bacterium]